MTVKWNSLQSIFLFLLGRSYQEKSIDQVYVKLSTFTVFYFQNLFLFFFTHLSWWEPLKYYVHIVKIPVRKFYEMLVMVYFKGLDFFFHNLNAVLWDIVWCIVYTGTAPNVYIKETKLKHVIWLLVRHFEGKGCFFKENSKGIKEACKLHEFFKLRVFSRIE